MDVHVLGGGGVQERRGGQVEGAELTQLLVKEVKRVNGGGKKGSNRNLSKSRRADKHV